MKKIWSLLCLLWIGICSVKAQELQFSKDGKFKIVQFTDVHYIYNDPRSAISIERIHEVLDSERPDLIIFTGDLIYGKPAEESMRTLLQEVGKHNIPFAVTFGNHDDEQGLSRTELLNIIVSMPHNLTTTTEGLSGVTNYALPILSSDGKKYAEILYLFDSHSYSKINGVGGYAFIERDQIDWYCQKSSYYAQANNQIPVPALAFFHIPLPEYNAASAAENAPFFGVRKEQACAPRLNSGLFAAMKQMNDVKGVFVGHDHDNDYAVMWHQVLLAYGRYTGGNTVYNNLPNGARVIELTEGMEGFQTWIRTKDNHTEQHVVFPDSFLKPNK